MDEDLLELENELKRLPARRPSAAFSSALAGELAPPAGLKPVRRYATATSLRSWKWASWSLAGAAAIVALAFAVSSVRDSQVGTDRFPPVAAAATVVAAEQPHSPTLAGNRYEPVQATSVLYDRQESAPTTLPDRTEGRAVRYRYVDTYTWKNPATNASLRWSVPRDEVRLIRANLD